MRLDKFLQVSRLVKRRALANQLCDGGHVHRDGRAARASAEVEAGQEIEIDYGWRQVTVRIRAVPAGQVGRATATELYDLLREVRRPDGPADPEA